MADKVSLGTALSEAAFDDAEKDQELGEEVDIGLRKSKVKQWVTPDSDDEFDENRFFDIQEAWNQILNLPSCITIMLPLQEQEKLKLVVGTHVTQEFPWKQIQLQKLHDAQTFDYVPNGELLQDIFINHKPDYYLLIGYVPMLTQDDENIPAEDPFVTFYNPLDAKNALIIIRNIDAYEHWLMSQRLLKKPRIWPSLGSEMEVNLLQKQSILEPVNVEIQSRYPLRIPAEKQFTLRKTSDVRDGYVELVLPENVKIDNINRKRITIGIQSCPELVTVEQQTNPTFPTNAWSQYLYEIDETDACLDETSEEEEGTQSKPTTAGSGKSSVKPSAPPPELSDQIKLLLRTLEFNQVDMYRDDYPLIAKREINNYVIPNLQESLCFAHISKSFQRYVCAIDWYPSISGLLAVSYTFTTPVTSKLAVQNINVVQRDVLQPNPILMWSFADNLNYKLEFLSPTEVTALSFCPYNDKLLIGGMSNGRIVIWDLQDRIEKLDYVEMLTAAQQRYRLMLNEFLNWTILIDEDYLVAPTLMTGLEVSQKASITSIHWLGDRFYLSDLGKTMKVRGSAESTNYFMTCAVDGSIFIWNLNSLKDRVGGAAARRDMPKALTQNESLLKNKILKPSYKLIFQEPITCILGDTSNFQSIPVLPAKRRTNKLNYNIKIIANDPVEMRQTLIASTFFGHIEKVEWHGMYGGDETCESVSHVESFARVHNGPITFMKRNPFIRELFVTIGRNIFAVWWEDFSYTPLFWRKSATEITSVAWSENRPAVLFLTRIDGSLEAWDIIARDDYASLDKVIGGGIVTAISEHKLTEPEKLLGIGDYNSSLRMVRLPETFYHLLDNELKKFLEYINKEKSRKQAIQIWEEKYYENNKDVIEARRQAEQEARAEIERLKKEQTQLEIRKEVEQEEGERIGGYRSLSYPERMAVQWDELNLKRMLNILMSRKRVDAEQLKIDTRMEKERLAYEAAKKESVQHVRRNLANEIAAVRARILPAEKIDLTRSDMIKAQVEEIMREIIPYDTIVAEHDVIMERFNVFDEIDYFEYIKRGKQRRRLLNKSLGGNTERLYWYDNARYEGILDDCDWGFDYYLAREISSGENEREPDAINVPEESAILLSEEIEEDDI